MTPVFKAVAHPWQCDVLEHLTTRHYVAIFDDASYHYLYRLFGWNGNKDAEGRLAWVDVKHTVSYLAEVSAGDLLEVVSHPRQPRRQAAPLVHEGGYDARVEFDDGSRGRRFGDPE